MFEEVLIVEVEELPQSCIDLIAGIQGEIAKVIVGQKDLLDRLLIVLICKQHVLLEGLPGLAKTLTISTLGKVVNADFGRVQFTPDLLPADLTGTMIYHPAKGDFSPRKGPIFTNVLLADEINRAPAKVQSALLEAMQERQVTIGEETHPLLEPFMVLATQNPVEQEGTYPLPEAQLDRFMLKVLVDYPSREEELTVLRNQSGPDPLPEPRGVCSLEDIQTLQELLRKLYIAPDLEEYIMDIIQATRCPEDFNLDLGNYIQFGASPRGTIFLSLAARALALIRGRAYVSPEDVKTMAPDVLRHRILLSYEAEADGHNADWVIRQILEGLPVL